MVLQSFQVDAFTENLFSGNPAAVVMLKEKLPDGTLRKIAQENAVPETAFILPDGEDFSLRWFTPDIEMDLCGHATLASAHIIFTQYKYSRPEIVFKTASGLLSVKRDSDGYALDFPEREAHNAKLPQEIYESLSIKPVEVLKARDYMLVYQQQEDIEKIEVDRSVFDKVNIDPGGVIVTAPGRNCDFVSRFFTPQATLLEDPVTGSAHCTLAPYWGKRYNKLSMNAMQLSKRGGVVECSLLNGRVIIKGKAVIYSKSEIFI